MKTGLLKIGLFSAVTACAQHAHQPAPQLADTQRQEEVAQHGVDVMPFNLKATTHVFSKTADGGTQRVVAKDPPDTDQIRLVREHLREIQSQFIRGDFSGPAHIHGNDMPGLTALKAARPGQMSITYRDIADGGELTYRTHDAKLVTALHQWFDAQLSDHGTDAMAGHDHHHGGMDHGAHHRAPVRSEAK